MRSYDLLTEWEKLQIKISTAEDEWGTFVRLGKIKQNSVIAPEIVSSWQRCRERGVDPYNEELTVLSKAELEERRNKNKELLSIAGPLLREMGEGIGDTGIRFDYYDKDLYLLDRFGQDSLDSTAPKRFLPLGVSQKEIDSGTNATNLAMLLGRPIQLISYEHYNVSNHQFTCSAIPLCGMDGNIAAVINIDMHCWPIHKHTVGMLIAMKRNIEYTLYLKGEYRENSNEETTKAICQEAINCLGKPFVAVNGGGIILMENIVARDMLNGGRREIVGTSCATIWGDGNPFLEVIHSRKPIINREMMFNLGDKTVRFNGSIKPIKGEGDTILAVIGIFEEKIEGKMKFGKEWKAYYSFENLIGQSEVMVQTIQLAKETAKINSNTLIQGESGTGKELFAQSIHNASLYRDGPFVAVNCSAIPFGLLESELFGYENGAFTGAAKGGRLGKFEIARNGTLFLDEINSMPVDMQSKILRAIQNKSITRIGGSEEVSINIRIITAANVDLWKLVKEGEFREDLFYRINVITISLPSLRDRVEDIPVLINHFLASLSNKTQKELRIDEGALELMGQYNWPGNIRELENCIERSWVIATAMETDVITSEILLKYRGINDFYLNKEYFNEKRQFPLKHKMKDLNLLEKDEIQRVLTKYNYNIQKSAKELGMARNTLYRKIDNYNLKR